MKNLLFIFFLLTSLCAKSVEELKNLEKSLPKDFLIYQGLKDDKFTSDEAKELLNEVFIYNSKIEKEFQRVIVDDEFNFQYDCKNTKSDDLLNLSDECLYLSLSPNKVQFISDKDKKKLYEELKELHEDNLSWLKSMLQKDIFKSLIESGDFVKVFLSVNEEYRKRFLDKNLSKKDLEKLTKMDGFERFIFVLILQDSYPNLTNTILNTNDKHLTFEANFYLSLLSLMKGKKSLCLEFLRLSYHSAKNQEERDKTLFWLYQVSKDEKALLKLSQSVDFNIYSSYAKEFFNKHHKTITIKAKKNNLKGFDITDPFLWIKIKNEIKDYNQSELLKLSENFFTKDTLPHYVFFQKRLNGYENPYIITPYDQYLKDVSNERKALIYAIARQESRFIPVVVSKSYALGLMQFMPFLAKEISESLNLLDFKYEDMFKPEISLKFANIHLDYLQKHLFNPLLVAYAYNGGIGFVRRMLEKRFKNNEFEPFLSMELVDIHETREYGKNVLANFIEYGKIYDLNITLKEIFENLKESTRSYQFSR